MDTNNKIYGYVRPSLIYKDPTIQIEALKKFGIVEENIFVEEDSKERDRKKWNELRSLLKKDDIVVVQKLDRLGHSISEVVKIIEELNQENIHLVALDDEIDTRIEGTMTKAFFSFMKLVGEMEKTFIQERTKPAIEAAKRKGVKFGARRKNEEEYQKAIEMYLTGKFTVPQVLSKFPNLSEATFYRRLKEARKKVQEQSL